MPKVSNCTQIQIKLLYKQDLHLAEIFKLLKGEGLLISFVSETGIIKRLRLAGLVANLPRSGRPTKLSVEANAFIDQQMRSNDEVSSAQIQKKLVKCGIAVSSSNCCSIENRFIYYRFNLGNPTILFYYYEIVRALNPFSPKPVRLNLPRFFCAFYLDTHKSPSSAGLFDGRRTIIAHSAAKGPLHSHFVALNLAAPLLV